MPGVWLLHGIYAGVYGFSERRVVLSVSGLHDCGNCHGAADGAAAGKSISSAALGLFRTQVSGRRIYLPCGSSTLGRSGYICDKISQSPADGTAENHTISAGNPGTVMSLADSGGGYQYDRWGAA